MVPSKTPTAPKYYPNEDHRPAIGFAAGRMRWRPAIAPNEMRNGLRYFIEPVRNARSAGNRDGNGPEQRMLWYRTAPTSGAAVRVESDTTTMMPDQDAKIDFSNPATLKNWPSVNKERVSAALFVRDVFKRIERHARHAGVAILRDQRSFGERRVFGDRSMGFANALKNAQVQKGFVALQAGQDLLMLKETQAMELLSFCSRIPQN
jgi:hypothetical protein